MTREELFKIVVQHIESLSKRNKIVRTWIDIEEDSHIFFHLGLDSLDMTELIMDLEATLRISIPDTDYENIVRVSELVTLLENKTP